MANAVAAKNRVRCNSSIVNYVHRREFNGREDGRRGLVRSRLAEAKSLYRRDLLGHYGCVNAIEFSQGSAEWIVSGGDDRRVLVWNIQEALSGIDKPKVMKGQHNSNIFCLSFDQSNRKIFSGGNDEQVVVHDFETGSTLDVFPHDDVVYGLSVDPNNDHVFASAADDGKVRIFDVREQPKSEDQAFCLAACPSSMHAVMYNPAEPRLLLTANNDEGVGLWDIRKPKKCLLKYGGDMGRKQQHDCMSVRLNHLGTQLIGLYRRRPLMLYNIDSATPVCKFSSSHTEYLNCCTMKSCCFAGDKDEYVLSGSDLFHVFMWEVPDMDRPTQGSSVYHVHSTHMLLKGHRSIVNQVRYSNVNHLLVSSGVEKVVKIWSPFPLPGGDGDLTDENSSKRPERVRFTQEQSMSIVLRHDMSHDYSNGSVEEDPHMMAFFDSLIQAGGDPWSSDDDDDDDDDAGGGDGGGGDSSDFFLHPFPGAGSEHSDSSSPSPSSDGEPFLLRVGEGPTAGAVPSEEPGLHQPSSSSSSSSSSASSVMSWDRPSRPSLAVAPKSGRAPADDSTDSDSDTRSADREACSRLEPDAPYRARAKRAVRRLRQMRARVVNSDVSDTEEESPTHGLVASRPAEDPGTDQASSSNDLTCLDAEHDCKGCDTNASHDVNSVDENSTRHSEAHGVYCGKNRDKGSEAVGVASCAEKGLNVSPVAVPHTDSLNSEARSVNQYKTTTNGNTLVSDNLPNGQESPAVQKSKGGNTDFSVSRETTLRGEVNGNHLCVASTSSASSAGLDLSREHDLTGTCDQPVKTSFKQLKNRNVSRVRRQYRCHSSSSSHNQSSGEEF